MAATVQCLVGLLNFFRLLSVLDQLVSLFCPFTLTSPLKLTISAFGFLACNFYFLPLGLTFALFPLSISLLSDLFNPSLKFLALLLI